MNKMQTYLALTLLVCATPVAIGQETHILFGDRSSTIPMDGNLPVQVGRGFVVAGDRASETEVYFSGDEVDYRVPNGVWLSKGKGFQVGGGRGAIQIRYPGGVGVIEVQFVDTSTIGPPPLSDGCDIKVAARASSLALETLRTQIGGDATLRTQNVRQLFQPMASGQISAMETSIYI